MKYKYYLRDTTSPRKLEIFFYVKDVVRHGTLPQSATRPLKTYSTAVRAIPLSACHQGPPSGNRTGFKKLSDAQQFIQLTVVGDINAKSG